MQQGAWGVAVFLAALMVVAGAVAVILPMGEATHEGGWCAQTLETIPFGTGEVGYDLEPLEGVNHYDLPYPACSAGRYNIDHESDTVVTEQHCAEGFLRVYASPGGINVKVLVNWLPATSAGCG